MKYAEVCAGISAASVAWHPLGWKSIFFAEIEKFQSKVLAHHYPDVPNLGDMNLINGSNYAGAIDVLMGGTPCQSFSVAGLRAGISDPRGGLALRFLEIARDARPRWLVWENVPGVLSSNAGRDFGALIGGMAELGYGVAYRVLDAQYFGVAQRRRRVFVVACAGNWRSAAAVLFDRESMQGNLISSEKKRAQITGSTHSGSRRGDWPAEVAPTLDKGFGHKLGLTNQHIHDQRAGLFVLSSGQANSELSQTVFPTLTKLHEAPIVFDLQQITSPNNRSKVYPGQPCPTLTKGSDICISFNGKQHAVSGQEVSGTIDAHHFGMSSCVLHSNTIRRITPVEAERLQGFPDGYTAIKGAKTPDGPRYSALGNSIAVPVLAWIGQRIENLSKKIVVTLAFNNKTPLSLHHQINHLSNICHGKSIQNQPDPGSH